MRTPTQRFTQWVLRESGQVRARELYDYSDGLVEVQNLAAQSPDRVNQLVDQLTRVAGLDAAEFSGPGSGVVPSPTTSFERAKPGPFKHLVTAIGTWKVDSGQAIIDDKRAKTGKQSLMLTRSEDDGMTWSKPINVTEQVKRPEWCFVLQGPGKGITMQDGTLVFAAQYQDPPERDRLPHSTIIYSKDHGTTWQVGTGAFDDTTEAQVVEVRPGVLMLNCRYNRAPVRVVMTTSDMGATWQKHTTSERSLIEPGSCMASLIDAGSSGAGGPGDWLLFSNPDSTRGRRHITIKASPDRGLTWPKQYRRLLDSGDGRGYSCMSMIDNQTVGILYEGSQTHMTFERIPLSQILKPDDKTQQTPGTADHSADNRLQVPQVFGDHMVLQADAEAGRPNIYQLYDLDADPHEWVNLASAPQHSETLGRLKTALKQWQIDSDDPLRDREKLRMLVEENEAVFRSGRRSPEDGWRYLQYLGPGANEAQ